MNQRGFSLIEVMIAMGITMAIMGAVFSLLEKGQESFIREPEITDMQQSTRAGLQMISRDLIPAGMGTPPVFAVMPSDGGSGPDMLTIVYVDGEIPISSPLPCDGIEVSDPFVDAESTKMGPRGSGPCNTIDKSSTLLINPESFIPPQDYPEEAYSRGQTLFAMETSDCNGDGQMGIYPFEISQDPAMNVAGGEETLRLNHNPGKQESGVNLPGGFNRQISPDCAIIGRFFAIQYRINPVPPTQNPQLEKRVMGGEWTPAANNIEDLQVEYGVGMNINEFFDQPVALFTDPETWITHVKITITGRTESRNLSGSTEGVDGTYIRETLSSVTALRNQLYHVEAGILP